jgi:hypothetical protein
MGKKSEEKLKKWWSQSRFILAFGCKKERR